LNSVMTSRVTVIRSLAIATVVLLLGVLLPDMALDSDNVVGVTSQLEDNECMTMSPCMLAPSCPSHCSAVEDAHFAAVPIDLGNPLTPASVLYLVSGPATLLKPPPRFGRLS